MARKWRDHTGPPGRFERVPLTDQEKLLGRYCPRCYTWIPVERYSDHAWYEGEPGQENLL